MTGSLTGGTIVAWMLGVDHYFSPAPGSRHRPRTVNLKLSDISLDLQTDRGVFSADRIDPGTLLLLGHAPLPPAPAGNGGTTAPRRVLADVGCGYGPISVAMALRAPDASIWAVDVNERARALTKQNLAAAGISIAGGLQQARPNARAVVCAPEEIPAELRLDAFYCNPPVRIGKQAIDEMLGRWLGRLRPEGFAVLVMHKNLGADSLARRLATSGWTPRRLAIGGGYRVWQVCSDRAES